MAERMKSSPTETDPLADGWVKRKVRWDGKILEEMTIGWVQTNRKGDRYCSFLGGLEGPLFGMFTGGKQGLRNGTEAFGAALPHRLGDAKEGWKEAADAARGFKMRSKAKDK